MEERAGVEDRLRRFAAQVLRREQMRERVLMKPALALMVKLGSRLAVAMPTCVLAA